MGGSIYLYSALEAARAHPSQALAILGTASMAGRA